MANIHLWIIIITTVICASITIAYGLIMRQRFKEKGYYDPKREIPIEFKPLNDISFEEYIALLPKLPKTAPQAILVYMDRQRKIEIKGSEIYRNVASLTWAETQFLDLIERERDHRWDLLKSFLHDKNGVKLKSPAKVFQTDSILRKGLLEKDLIKNKPSGLRLRALCAMILMGATAALCVMDSVFDIFHASSDLVTSSQLFWLVFSSDIVICFAILAYEHRYYSTLSQYTPEGKAVLDYYAGLKRYIKHVEKERLDYLQDKNNSDFQELTPYMILFGLEGQWTHKLRRYQRVWIRV